MNGEHEARGSCKYFQLHLAAQALKQIEMDSEARVGSEETGAVEKGIRAQRTVGPSRQKSCPCWHASKDIIKSQIFGGPIRNF